MKAKELKEGSEVTSLTLRVTRRWNIRSTGNGLEEFSDDGPLKAERSKVFTVLVRDETSPEDHTEMMIFFYDLWAEKCFFIQNGDKLIISGAKEMIFLSTGDLQDFPLCLVFTPEIQSEVRNQTTLLFEFFLIFSHSISLSLRSSQSRVSTSITLQDLQRLPHETSPI